MQIMGINRSVKMTRLLLAFIVLAALRVGAELASDFRSDFDETVLIDGLNSPTDLDVAPDGSDLLLLALQGGTIYAVTGSASAKDEDDVDKYEIADLADLMCHNGSRGLVGLSFHPKFSTATSVEGDDTMWVYAFYTAIGKGDCYTGKWSVDDLPAPEGTVNVLSRFPILGDPSSGGKITLDMKNEQILLETAVQMSHNHNGGDIAFASDGMLYLTLGDGLSNKLKNDKGLPYEQALDVLFGKIIRLTPEGDIPQDNPYTPANGYDNAVFCGKSDGFSGSSKKPCAEIYASGLRNPFRFAFDPNKSAAEDGSPRFWINDVGGSSFERILEGKRGGNYGYPDIKGPCSNELEKGGKCEAPEEFGFDPSLHWYEHDSERGACISGGAFIPSNIGWPADFEGAYVYGDYKLGGIYRMTPGGKGCSASDCKVPISAYNDDENTLIEFSDATATVSMHFGPYNGGTPQALYFLTRGAGRGSNEKGRPEGLVRISYLGTQQTNDRPLAVIETDIRIGFNPLTVNFDGRKSSDPDGDDSALSFAWDYDGDGLSDEFAPKGSFVYKAPGLYEVTLEVTDSGGATDKTSVYITVDNSPPVPVIQSPAGDVQFAVDDSIRLVGSATDSEDGTLSPSSLTWYIRENHGDHYHTIMGPKSGSDVTFVMSGPVGFEAVESSYLEAVLTATDSRGLSSTAVKILRPKVHSVTIDSSPSGLQVSVYDQIVQTPKTIVAWENQEVEIEAVEDDTRYKFETWSDGGDRAHSFIVNPSELDVVAYFKAVEVEEEEEEVSATPKEPASSTTKEDEDIEDTEEEKETIEESFEDTTTLDVSDSDADKIKAKLLDFSIIINLDTEGYRNRQLGEYIKSPVFPYLNKNLEDIVSSSMRKELKTLVKSSGLPYAKPIDVSLTRKKKKGHDDGRRYEAVFGGKVTFKKKKEDQRLPSISAIQNMQKQVLVRVGDGVVDDIEESVKGAVVSSVVTDIVYTDPEEPTSQVQDIFAMSEDGSSNNTTTIIMVVCFVVAGIGIVALAAFFIIRSRRVINKTSPPLPPKKEGQADLNETGETYSGYEL